MEKNVEKVLQGVALFAALAAFAAVVALTSGCSSADCGSKTVVGNHCSLPSLSSDATDFDFEVYRSTEGAVVYTRKDSRVGITFYNAYTNHIFGIWDKAGEMRLSVEIEPLAEEADFRSQIAEGGEQISDFRSQIAEGGEQISDFRSQIAEGGEQILEDGEQISEEGGGR